MTTPSDLLRQAADILRARASKASPGPWFLNGYGVQNAKYGVSYDSREEDARWIATMSPDKAEPVAAWLEDEASIEDGLQALYGESISPHALEFAKSIVGESSD